MSAISAELAPPSTEQQKQRIFPPVGFFGRLFAPFIALALGLLSAERKLIFLKRLALTKERISDQRLFKRLKKQLSKESLEFAKLIQLGYTQFGQRSDRNWQGVQTNERGKRKKVAKIQFQVIAFDSELLYYKVLTRKRSLFGTRPTLPYGVRVADLVTAEAKLQLETTLERQISFRLEAKTGLWVLVHRLAGAGGIPRFVSYNEILPHYKSPERYQLILGIGERKAVHSIYLDEQPHILIGGATQTGKSNLVNFFISTLVRNLLPGELQLILIDLKQVEFNHFEDIPHLKYPIIFDAKNAFDALAAMKLEMTQRGSLFNLSKAKNIQQYNASHPNNQLPRWVCFIDEFAEIVNGDDAVLAESTFKLVKSITSVGRALGIHLFICTQRPDAQVVPMQVRNNVAVRIGGRTGDRYASQVLIESDRLVKLPTDIKGRMAYRLGANVYEIQPPFISNEEVAESVGIARGRAAGVITLSNDQAVINRDGIARWIIKRNGGSMAQKPLFTVLRDYGITEKMLEATLLDLRGQKEITLSTGQRYRIEARGRTWYIVSPDSPPQESIQAPVVDPVTPQVEEFDFSDASIEAALNSVWGLPDAEKVWEVLQPSTNKLPPADTPFDPIQMFIDDCCEVKQDAFVPVRELHPVYMEWCKSKGYLFDANNEFSRKVKAKGYKAAKRSDIRVLIGLTLRQPVQPANLQHVSSMEEM